MYANPGESPEGRARLLPRLARRVPLFRRLAVSRMGPLEAAMEDLRAEVAGLRAEFAGVREALAGSEPRIGELQQATESVAHNFELLKGELWDTRVELSSGRVVEVREQVTALERRLRRLERGATTPVAPVADAPTGEAGTAGSPSTDISSTLFDYVGFERRFRGHPDVINSVLRDRYADLLRGHQPVVDIGCGRGELLELLAGEGIEVVGVEPDPGMADEARARGIEVHQVLASDYLASVPDGSLGAIISTHVIEHLPLEILVDFLETSARKLVPGGIFVAETPNPATLVVLGSHFIMDPTHVWPLHPDLMSFLCESAGFRDVRVDFFSPATTLQLPLSNGAPSADPALSDRVDEAFARLNHVLFGPQDYAVIATVGDRTIDPAEEATSGEVADTVS
jgi:SAM-dependent methyltransferase